jgi:hypothetical protein
MNITKIFFFLALLTGMSIKSGFCYANNVPGGPVNNLVKISSSSIANNKRNKTSTVVLGLTNRLKLKTPLYDQLTVVIASFSAPNITLANATGFTSSNQPFITIRLPKGILKAGKSAPKTKLKFNNPTGKKFKATYTVYGLLTPNKQPIANAGRDETVILGEKKVLDGTASSDPDSNTLSYQWSLIQKPANSATNLIASETTNPQLTNIDVVGEYRVQLIVNDGILDSAPANITLNASAQNSPHAPPINAPTNLNRLQVTPLIIPTGNSVPITVSMQILEFDLIADSIQLNRLDNSGNPISYLGKLHDDGLNGDETAGDSIFSTRVNLQEPQETSILLGASAAFGVPPYIIKSPPTIIDVKPNILLNTPLAKYNRQRIIFTDLQGKNISEIPVIQETQTIKNGDNSVFTVTEEKPIISLNQRYVGILKTQTLSLDIPGDESENDMQLAQEFRYMDASGTLWTKNPEGTGRNFYIPEYSPIISADGERVLLLEVSEGDNDPKLSVYTASGLRIFNEILEFSVITEAKMSKNGRYVFLRGEPKSSQKGGVTLSIIDIDNPINRWSNSFSGFSTKSERYIENTAGGFDVWINDVMIASFPN